MILLGDVREKLKELSAGSVQCVVTSPPYWGLRDYGTGKWDGGDEGCDHLGKPMATKANINRNCGTGTDVKNAEAREFFKDVCGKCGARRIDSQIGLEQTPEHYVAEMVAVFREVWRVLADDGVLWLNLGDSYASDQKGTGGPSKKQTSNAGSRYEPRKLAHGLKQKDLVGIPWRVAFALQADGWYLRQDIIWHKPNPMPESVTDRCTKSHEYVFMLTKSGRYYFDNKAIAEPAKFAGDDRGSRGDARRGSRMNSMSGKTGDTRNKRDVWTIATKPFKGAHFAVMPEALVEPCILASSRAGDTVLDPFLGSGTVAVVATRLGREWVGCELNPEYAKIAAQRIESTPARLNL